MILCTKRTTPLEGFTLSQDFQLSMKTGDLNPRFRPAGFGCVARCGLTNRCAGQLAPVMFLAKTRIVPYAQLPVS
jgi:hypothetical protein